MSPGLIVVNPNPALDRVEVVANFSLGQPIRVETVCLYPGGSATHAGLVATQLGKRNVRVLAPVGGVTGQQWMRALASWGIAVEPIAIEGETRTNVSIIDRQRGVQVECIEPGPRVTPDQVGRLVDRLARWLQPGGVVVIGGSLPPGWPISEVGNLIDLVRETHAMVVSDLAGSALQEAVGHASDWIKANAVEFADWAMDGETPHLLSVWRRLRGLPLPRVNLVISLGREGTLWRRAAGETAYFAPLTDVAAFNAVGCGDAMVGALAAGLISGQDPVEMLKTAVAAASSNLAYCEAGRVDCAVVDDLRHRVEWTWANEEREIATWMHRLGNACD